MMKKYLMLMGYGLCALLIITGCASRTSRYDLNEWGLEYRLMELKDPRQNRVHILRVDLSGGKTEAAVVVAADPDGEGPAEVALTNPLKLAKDRSVLAFINTNGWDSFPNSAGEKNRNWYEGQLVDIAGLAVSGGHVRSADLKDDVSVWINKDGRVFLSAASDTAVVEGMAAGAQVVKEGTAIGHPNKALHPRTLIGVDRSGFVLWLVVVDGRQKNYSEGMNYDEMGPLMRDIGCWNAVNMDGGGSSIMGLVKPDGQMHVVNSPSDRYQGQTKIRPLPMVLTIRTKSE